MLHLSWLDKVEYIIQVHRANVIYFDTTCFLLNYRNSSTEFWV